jgi:hypothetical protein
MAEINPRTAKLRHTLVIIILATLPLYLIGIIVLWVGEAAKNARTPTPEISTVIITATPQPTQTLAFPTLYPTPTLTLTFTPTATYTITATFTETPLPTATLVPTETLMPTETFTVTPTETPTEANPG